jgi:hypothetical protein
MTEGFIKARQLTLVGFPYILFAFEANPLGAPFAGRSDVGDDTNLPGVSGSLSELLELGISTSEEDMVHGIKRGARWEEIVNRRPFRKGLEMYL